MEKILIKDKYNLKEETKNLEYPLPAWYNELIKKTEDEISLLDINRMVRQNILVEVSLKKAVQEMLKDPFIGEQTNGDLLEHAIKLDSELLKQYTKEFKEIIKKANENLNSFAWWYPEEKYEYLDLIKELKKKLK